MDVNLGDDLISKAISDLINKVEISIAGDLKKLFENESIIKLLQLDNIDVRDITNALKYLIDDMALSFGEPVNVGLYVATAYLASDSNYRAEIAVKNFTISKSISIIEITSYNNKVYDGNAYEVEFSVKDRDGKIVENATFVV